MPSRFALGAFLVLAAWGCSGNGYGSGDAGMPTPATSSSANASFVNIVGQKAAQSFDPNPAPIAQGALVVWHNMDTTTHRIVMNDGSFDSGDIAPGGSSQTMRLSSTGGSYHCTIHPTMMFGSIN
jgi:plastocyanin